MVVTSEARVEHNKVVFLCLCSETWQHIGGNWKIVDFKSSFTTNAPDKSSCVRNSLLTLMYGLIVAKKL